MTKPGEGQALVTEAERSGRQPVGRTARDEPRHAATLDTTHPRDLARSPSLVDGEGGEDPARASTVTAQLARSTSRRGDRGTPDYGWKKPEEPRGEQLDLFGGPTDE